MTTYRYECMDATGSEVSGFMDANSEDEVHARLREQGYFVTKIGPRCAGRSLLPAVVAFRQTGFAALVRRVK
jgi:type II secretory pathway component PulF